MSEVLPIPFGPTMAMRAPLATVKDTPLKISVGPYDFASELTVRSDMFFQLPDLNAPYYKRKELLIALLFMFAILIARLYFGEPFQNFTWEKKSCA